MKVGGFQKVSLVDYPGYVCSIIFTIGCNFRCAYCYNHSLVLPEEYPEPIPLEEVWQYLRRRKGRIDAVEFTGGEPTLQKDLIEQISRVKEMGFLVKLDTNGSNPEVVDSCIKKGIVDYIAMDVKAPLEKYREVVGVYVDTGKIKASIDMIKGFKDYELRTTLYPALTDEDFLKIFELVKGAKNYFLQVCSLENTLKDCSHLKQFSEKEIQNLKRLTSNFVNYCEIRR
ncbi:MAG: anaerobic ribonucleoside-triphosphate reductase activating protein [Candidatus Cloacimonas sp. 4484_209]|nr:MAG: anaerobic ribonucleoside-triphosphate reductase activating protein [Candidatus Cloacimonas sp. 4484_209]